MSTANEANNSQPSNSENPPPSTTTETQTTTPEAQTEQGKDEVVVQPLTAESIKIPEGFQVDEAVRNNFLSILNDDKLSGADRAQKLIDLQAEFMKSQDAALTAEWEKQQETWVNEVKADPEVGGDKMDAVLADIQKVVLEYGSPEVNEILTNTGAGNNIHMVRMMHKIAKALNEGNGHATGNPPPDAKTAAQKLFPSMK